MAIKRLLCPRLLDGDIKQWCCLSVWRLSVAYIGPKSRTERPRKTKIGTKPTSHVIRTPLSRSKGQGHRGRGHIVASSHLHLVAVALMWLVGWQEWRPACISKTFRRPGLIWSNLWKIGRLNNNKRNRFVYWPLIRVKPGEPAPEMYNSYSDHGRH